MENRLSLYSRGIASSKHKELLVKDKNSSNVVTVTFDVVGEEYSFPVKYRTLIEMDEDEDDNYDVVAFLIGVEQMSGSAYRARYCFKVEV